MTIGSALASDAPALTALWSTAFSEDSAEDIASFLHRFLTPDTAFVVKDNSRVVSMVFLLPATVYHDGREMPVGYIYAGATLPTYRGQGWYRRLLDHVVGTAKEQGFAALFLRPADEALGNSYRRMGFIVPLITCRQNGGMDRRVSQPLPVAAFMTQKHERLLHAGVPHIVWSSAVTAYLQSFTTACRLADDTLVLMSLDGTCVECIPAAGVHEPLSAGLLRPLREGLHWDARSIYMGYGLE